MWMGNTFARGYHKVCKVYLNAHWLEQNKSTSYFYQATHGWLRAPSVQWRWIHANHNESRKCGDHPWHVHLQRSGTVLPCSSSHSCVNLNAVSSHEKTVDRQNLAPLWVSGNSLEIAEAFHSKDWKWGIQAAIKLYQSFRWIHSHSFYQQYSTIISWYEYNSITSTSISYSPSHFMGMGRAEPGGSQRHMRPLKGAKSVVEASWSSSYGVCFQKFAVPPAPLCVSCKCLVIFTVCCTYLCLYTDFLKSNIQLQSITPRS